MRKIEQQMLAAIKDGRNSAVKTAWQNDNTAIRFHDLDWKQGLCSVFLHGNLIAIVDLSTNDATPDILTFRRFPTRTTVSRLRALGINACVRKGVPMIDGKPV